MEQNFGTSAPTTPAAPAVDKKQKSGAGLKILAVFALIIAICGIGFGVYGMMQSSKDQISDFKIQTVNKDGSTTILETDKIEISNDSKTITISNSENKNNPIISATKPEEYFQSFMTGAYIYNLTEGDEYLAAIGIKDGKIDGCAVYRRTRKYIGYDLVETTKHEKDCKGIKGLSGNIYKVVDVGEGQTPEANNVAFIMEDGTVQYISGRKMVTGLIDNDTVTIDGTLKIDGVVTDALTVIVGEENVPGGVYHTTIFVLSGGDTIRYNESMLK